MLDVDYDAMVKALNPNEKKIISKGIQSVRARQRIFEVILHQLIRTYLILNLKILWPQNS